MEPKNAAQQILDGRGPANSLRRTSFSPMKALRTLSIGSIASIGSQVSNTSDSDAASVTERRRSTLRKIRPSESHMELARQPSQASSEAYTESSTFTRPATPGTGSQGTSISEEFASVIMSGFLYSEPKVLKPKKDFAVLTSAALLKFKSKLAAMEMFPQIDLPASTIEALSSADSVTSFRGFGAAAEVMVPLEKVVAAFKNESTKPCFGIELWWKDPNAASTFATMELNFTMPEDRDDWLKQIQHATKHRSRALSEDRTPSHIGFEFTQILEARNAELKKTHIEIFPVIPRRPYTRLRTNLGEIKKGWRNGSSFYLALSKNVCLLAQFSSSPSGQRVNPNLVQFGLVTLSKVNGSLNDERFELIFRLPLDQPKKIELASRYHRSIISRLLKADTYLKPAWPLWTRREVFFIDGEGQQIHLPEGEDYGGLKRTLEAFLEGYHCAPVVWKVNWKGVKYSPEFQLLPPTTKRRYTAHQLLAVLRALRFNDFFKSLSFRDVDFTAVAGIYDNSNRLEPSVWLSRTGKRSLTRDEFEEVENSTVLFQEIAALLLGSESVKHLDLGGVLSEVSTTTPADKSGGVSSSPGCEVVAPIVLLLRSLQTRCSSVVLSKNPISLTEASGLSQTLQILPGTMRRLALSSCQLDEASLTSLWAGIHEQRSSLEVLELAHNHGCIEATKVSGTLRDATKIHKLDLAHCLKGHLDGPLFRPWNSSPYEDPWRLEEVNLSGWKVNFDTISGLLRYMELEESSRLRQLVLNNCGITGEIATAIFCRLGPGRDIHLHLNENPLIEGSTDWIDLIHGNEAPRMLHIDMVQFKHESNFNRLVTALTHNTTIEFLSLVGTGPPTSASSETAELLTKFFETNSTLRYLDFSGFSGKLEDGHMGWGLSSALGGLRQNETLRQLRIRNQDIGAAEDVTELCRVIAGNTGLAMIDVQNNNFSHHQFSRIVHALELNSHIVSFPLSEADCDYALSKEKRLFAKNLSQPGKWPPKNMSKNEQARLDELLKWLKGYWNSEAEKVEEILKRNRDDTANHEITIDAEYLESWKDDDLPPWLLFKPEQNKGSKGKEYVHARTEMLKASSFVVSKNPTCGTLGAPRVHNALESAPQTYTIEEESPGQESPNSDYTSSYLNESPTGITRQQRVRE